MSNSLMIKKVKDAENTASILRQEAMDESRMEIRNAEEKASNQKKDKLKEARTALRAAIKKTEEKAQNESAKIREKEIAKNEQVKQDVKEKKPLAVKFIIENARKAID